MDALVKIDLEQVLDSGDPVGAYGAPFEYGGKLGQVVIETGALKSEKETRRKIEWFHDGKNIKNCNDGKDNNVQPDTPVSVLSLLSMKSVRSISSS